MMTERKWTPGPWRVEIDDCDDPVIFSECGCLELEGLCWSKNSDANAHLIAAAPELYDALADCEAWIRRYHNDDRPDIAGKARAALSKARGEA